MRETCMNDDAGKKLAEIFESQKLAVLASWDGEQSYASLVAFCVTPDLKTVFFATRQSTKKFANLESNPAVALLIDSRRNSEADFEDACAVTALGRASKAKEADKDELMKEYCRRHPGLSDFADAAGTVFICVRIGRYQVVSSFEDTSVLDMG
jgi:heme iron utilization protein